ncbi:MAG: hypothetical protein MUF28_01115 [Ignavibacterium sp.]|jgi:hypothetical protein|nr:hypothetical protein [Ignavibacterium sp.]
MKTIQAKWIRFDEQTNALDYLEKCFSFLKTVEYEPQNWKWVIITLHSALYGFAVSACKGMNSDSVITRTKSGHERLVDFDEALKRCQDPTWMRVNINYEEFKFSHNQLKSIRKLHKALRNNFEHFTPKSWSIELHSFPDMVYDCFEVIRLLIIYSDVSWGLRGVKLKRVKSIIYQSKRIIAKSILYKETLFLISKENSSK